ncbi:unnamed protein product [Colias eurytheme]|nr:unnamed protein product [Colias eurytheme]
MSNIILQKYLNDLLEIKQYLVKFGIKRLKSETAFEKYEVAKQVYKEYKNYIQVVEIKVEELSVTLEIDSLFDKIKNLMTIMSTKPEFELKTAVSLLPVMDDTENVTLQLIDAIELYVTMISKESITNLIQFVCKTRLSRNAKLRLKDTYSSVEEMVSDMKKHLLTTKSEIALQKKLLNCYQGNRSIDKFGTELEQLFVNLTISQSKGNSDTFSILKSINEKQAIHKFADGLRNDRLKTVIAARNYNSLKDAIQGAKDEEVTMTSPSSNQVFFAKGRPYHRGLQGSKHCGKSYSYTNSRSPKTQFKNTFTNYSCGRNQGNFQRGRGKTNGRNKSNTRSTQPYTHKNRNQHQQVNLAQSSQNEEDEDEQSSIPKWFFRQ